MAKKKSSPKKKPAIKSTNKKTVKKKVVQESLNETPLKTDSNEFQIEPLKKADYLFGLLKKVFGHE